MKFFPASKAETDRIRRERELEVFLERMNELTPDLTSRERVLVEALFKVFEERFRDLELQIAAKADPDYDEPGR